TSRPAAPTPRPSPPDGLIPLLPFLFSGHAHRRALHSFPTRRSSDLPALRRQRLPQQLLGRERDPCALLLTAERSGGPPLGIAERDRKSTRLNSSHRTISYAVFCLKKKNWRSPVWMRMRLLPVRRPEPATRRSSEIGRAHVCTPVTFRSRMPSSA